MERCRWGCPLLIERFEEKFVRECNGEILLRMSISGGKTLGVENLRDSDRQMITSLRVWKESV